MSRVAFVFDADRCTGCDACRLACTVENGLAPGVSWRQVFTFNARRHPAAPVFHLSLACNHCERAPCMEACPASAYRRDGATGAVSIDPDLCIGCRYCSWACPYDAPRFDEARGVMTKCTFCAQRLRAGDAPACASLCPTGALTFARLDAAPPAGELEGFADRGLGPALRVLPLREGHAMPAGLEPAAAAGPPEASAAPRRVSLRREWSLLAFTFAAALLAAVVIAAAAGGPRPPWIAIALGTALAMGLGAVHLGRPARAWRAVLGVRTSWLAREIVALPLFAAVACAWLALAPSSVPGGWLAAALGLLALACVDRVYGLARLPSFVRPHSAGTVLIALGLASIGAGLAPAALAIGALRLGLYARRTLGRVRAGTPPHAAFAMARVAFGFALPALAWWAGAHALAFTLAAAGDLLDRTEFYDGLEFESPQRGLDRALAARLAPPRGRAR